MRVGRRTRSRALRMDQHARIQALEVGRHAKRRTLGVFGTLLLVAMSAVALSSCGGSATSASIALGDEAAVAAAAANPVTVSPLPGTPDASPTTQISFLGAAGTTVANVSVVGSRSGTHPGRLQVYSTGTGESFIADKPFIAGERVTVHALAGAGGGAPTQAVTTTFTIAHQASVSQVQFPRNPGDPHAVQHYLSAPELTPSTVTITTPARTGAASGDLFLAPYQGLGAARADDRRTERRSGVVSPAARRGLSHQLPGADLRRQAGAHMVAGPHHQGGLRRGRRRDLQQLLPADRHGTRRQRLSRRPARDPAHPPGHRVDRRLRSDSHEPLLGARLRARDPAGLDHRGGRHQDRPGDVGVARARAHPPAELPQSRLLGGIPLGLRSHQLDLARTLERGRPAGERDALLAQHLDAV